MYICFIDYINNDHHQIEQLNILPVGTRKKVLRDQSKPVPLSTSPLPERRQSKVYNMTFDNIEECMVRKSGVGR
jgi:hypothetical protein